MQTPSLGQKLALAGVSVVSYWLILQLAQFLESAGGMPEPGRWVHYVVGVAFGALVMGPYAIAPYRGLRILALCVASVFIYYGAIRFVTDGPPGYDAMTSFILSGSGAAVLTGVAVALLAPARLSGKLVPLTLVAGAAGGAMFELRLSGDAMMLLGHAAWQFLVCLALHLSFREGRT